MSAIDVAGAGDVAAASDTSEAAALPYWSDLPYDMLLIVMEALNIPDLLSAGAVCSSWRPACSAVRRIRFPIADASPCLLYSSKLDDANTATIYSPSSKAAFKVRLPDPPFRSRHVVGSGHGWIVAADETSNLQALNPLTGAQVDLPPVTGLYHIESFFDDLHGNNLVYNQYYEYEEASIRLPWLYRPHELRLFLYHRAFLSCSPASGSQCIVLLQHRPTQQLSFARLGDEHWTRITDVEFLDKEDSFHNAVYNEKDGLFYVISYDGCVYTLDLNGPTPVARKIVRSIIEFDDCVKYIALAPSGDILHVWRYMDYRDSANPVYVRPELAHEYYNPNQEVYTYQMELYRVDTDEQTIERISSLENYALFLGFGSTTR
jgi:hypothetical protein